MQKKSRNLNQGIRVEKRDEHNIIINLLFSYNACFYSPPVGLKPIFPGAAIQPTPKSSARTANAHHNPKRMKTVLEVSPSLIIYKYLLNTSKLELFNASASQECSLCGNCRMVERGA